jgi:localization factor PodJL
MSANTSKTSAKATSGSKAKTPARTKKTATAKAKAQSKMKAQTKALKTRAAKVTPKAATAASAKKTRGVPKGTKRSALNKDGTPRKRPGPKPKAAATVKKAAPKKAAVKTKAKKAKAVAKKPAVAKAKPAKRKTVAKVKPVTKAKTAKAKAKTTKVRAKTAKPKATKAKTAKPKTAKKVRGVPKGTKRSAFNKDGTPRKRPGPKPKTVAAAKKVAVKTKPAAKKKVVAKKTIVAKTKVVTKAKAAPAKKVVKKPTKPVAKPVSKPVTKRVAKPAAARKAVKAKAPAKATVRKAAPVKRAVKSAQSPAPRNVKELHAHVERVSAKLSRADARMASNVKTLDAALKDLEARSTKSATSQRAGLVRRINTVKSQIASLAKDTRKNTRKDLEAALLAERPEQMKAILDKVEERIDAASREQSRSLARLNQHLADMARAMDARLVAIESAQASETESRRAAVDVLTGRIDAIESETARAVTDIGERMVALATGLRDEIEAVKPADNQDVSEKIASIASETQGELEAFRVNVDRRVDSAERSAADADSRVAEMARRQEGALAALATRIEGLEYALSNAPAPQPAAQPAMLAQSVPSLELGADMLQAAPAVAPEPVTPANFEEMAPVAADRDPNLPEHYPVEYVPPSTVDFSAAPEPVMPTPAGLMTEMDASAVPQPQFPQPQFAAPELQPLPDQPNMGVPQPDFLPLGEVEAHANAIPQPLPEIDPSIVPQIQDTDLPFTNPGYAETGATARPGGFEEAKPSLLSRLKGRNMRAAGLAVGVALVGTWAVSNAIGDGGRLDQAQQAAQVEAQAQDAQQMSTLSVPPTQSSISGASIQTTSPIGDTAALNVATVNADSPEGATLEAAVQAGNPIAQYQFGLMEVSRGNLPAGIASVRKAADQGLPAAQYRLAKFYETGEGVERDLPMAAQLTERAARAGHRIAMHDIGLFNAEGLATGEPNAVGAVEWFDKAARLGVVDSQFNLAYLLDQGEVIGVTPDPVQAYMWYSVATMNGDQQAGEYMERLKERMSAEQISAAESRVASFRVQPIDKAANGMFENLPWTPPAVATANAERENVRRVQQMLNQLGYDTGTPDGLMGPKTREAIVQYERTRQLPETGKPSPVLLSTLEGDVKA